MIVKCLDAHVSSESAHYTVYIVHFQVACNWSHDSADNSLQDVWRAEISQQFLKGIRLRHGSRECWKLLNCY